MGNPILLIIVAATMFAVIGGLTLASHLYNLNGIKSKTVGDGQHGTARFSSKGELHRIYKFVPFEPKAWRAAKGKNLHLPQGVIVGCQNKHGQTVALVDTGDVHTMMIGAAGCGKTAFWLYPNLEYACAAGMSFLTTDTKGDLYRNYGNIAKEQYGVDISEKALARHNGKAYFRPIIANFTKYEKLHEIIHDEIDVFYHFAWQGVFGDAFKDYHLQLSNAAYAVDALNEAIKIGCKKFVFAGTYNELEVTDHFDMSGQRPRYTCIYSAAKSVSEIICKTVAANSDIEYSAGLTVMAYGENNRSMMLPNVVLKQLVNGESPKLIEGNSPYDMIYIDDIARAFYAIGECGINLRSYYVGHRKLRTFREYVEEIGQIVAPDVPLLFGAYPDDNSGRNYDKIDLDALYRDTGFECQADFKESILKTAEWVKKNL